MLKLEHKYLINNYRKLLRICDLLNIPTKYLYNRLYKYTIDLLTPDLREAYIETNEINSIHEEDSTFRYIWVMWWQGLDKSPAIVQKNIVRLKNIFGENRIKVITKKNYSKYTNISPHILYLLKTKKITFTLWSDIIRYNLLKNNGGFWIDSTVVVSNKILSFSNKMFKSTYFSLCNNEEDYHFISHALWTGWFVGGKKGLPFFEFMNKFFEIYFNNHDYSCDYYLVDDATYYFYLKNKKFQKSVNQNKMNWYPYMFQKKLLKNFNYKDYKLFENDTRYCVQKITYKFKINNQTSKNALIFKLLRTDYK